MKHLIKVTLKATKSNINITEGRIQRWLFKWENNAITAYAISDYETAQISQPFDLVNKTNKLNLGLLIDALTIASNQDINTSIEISTEPVIDVYKTAKAPNIKSISQVTQLLRGARKVCNASSAGGNSGEVDGSITITFSKDQLLVIQDLISRLEKAKITNVNSKLMNYWRKGVELDRLQFMDASYLSFYKIIEYFISKSKLTDSPYQQFIKHLLKCSPKLSKLLYKHQRRSLRGAEKFAEGAKLINPQADQLELIANFIDMRNNWDIAHMRISPLPFDRSGRLYYSHIEDAWDYHSHICQITRLVILKNLGLNGLGLEEDGGLLKLIIVNNYY